METKAGGGLSGFMPRAKLRASSKAPSPPASGSRNVHNQATNFSVLKKDETFEKCPILVKVKEGENFNRRNILNISRIKI